MEELPISEPGAGEVVIAVKAAGVNDGRIDRVNAEALEIRGDFGVLDERAHLGTRLDLPTLDPTVAAACSWGQPRRNG